MLDNILPVSVRRQGLLNDGEVLTALPRYPLEEVRVPTMVIGLEDDLFGLWDAANYTAEHIPDARFVSYPDGGHVWVGRHQQVLEEMAAYIRE